MRILDRGIAPRDVKSRVTVAAPLEGCWRFLTDPSLMSEWFADPIRLPDGRMDLHFGDGDFFRVTRTAARQPDQLLWTWQFMGVGPRSEIEFLLTRKEGHTEVAVLDHGQYSLSGVHELEEGWEDFLTRLQRRIETGKNARYQWSETIGASIVLRDNPESVERALHDQAMWQRCFRDADVCLADSEAGLALNFSKSEWDGASTTASLSLSSSAAGLHLSVNHQGWLQLPETCRIAERKVAAQLWAEALRQLESAPVL